MLLPSHLVGFSAYGGSILLAGILADAAGRRTDRAIALATASNICKLPIAIRKSSIDISKTGCFDFLPAALNIPDIFGCLCPCWVRC